MADMDISPEVMEFFENLGNPEPAETEPTETVTETAQEPVSEAETVEEAPAVTETVVEQEEPVQPSQEEQPNEPEETNWEERYKNLQSAKDREVAEANQRIEQLNTWAQQQYAWQQQIVAEQQAQAQAAAQAQQAPPLQVSKEQVDHNLDLDPLGTFRTIALQRPDLMPNLISMVRGKEKLGNEVADAMMAEWTQFQMAQQAEQFQTQLQQMGQQQQQMMAPSPEQQVSGTMETIIGALEARYGEPFVAMADEISSKVEETGPQFKQYMQDHGLEITPQSVADFISQTYFDLRESRLNNVSAAPRGPQKLTPQQHIEAPGAERGRETTPDEDAMNELLQGARALGIDVSAPISA